MFNKQECLNCMSNFCRKRINVGLCNDGDCEFCCVNDAYEFIQDETFCEQHEDEEDEE